jgi:hypothetical protein
VCLNPILRILSFAKKGYIQIFDLLIYACFYQEAAIRSLPCITYYLVGGVFRLLVEKKMMYFCQYMIAYGFISILRHNLVGC